MATAAPARTGRPRSPEADRAIVRAALELIAEDGVAPLTVEAVAARAGVGKTTIYRRWPGKDELVVDALASLNDDLQDEWGTGTGDSARERLVQLLDLMRRRAQGTLGGRIFPAMAACSGTQPQLWALFHERVLEPRRELLRAQLRDGVRSGELRADLDIELAVNLLVGGMVYALNLRAPGVAVADDYAARLVALALDGIAR
jgi:AcrR family transcriptional regulator